MLLATLAGVAPDWVAAKETFPTQWRTSAGAAVLPGGVVSPVPDGVVAVPPVLPPKTPKFHRCYLNNFENVLLPAPVVAFPSPSLGGIRTGTAKAKEKLSSSVT